MFKSKYIFETKKTRTIRYIKNASFILFLSFVCYSISTLLFLLVSKNENTLTQEVFYKRPPDLIVVFTGHKGRIPYAVSLAKKYKQNSLFISGVHSKNTVDTLIAPMNLDGKINPDLLHIDYLARNTVENVLSTLQFLRKKPGLETILIVSHDYHIMRIKHIMNKLRTPDDRYRFYFAGVKTQYNSIRSVKILYKEVFKYIRTYLFLLLWDSDMTSY